MTERDNSIPYLLFLKLQTSGFYREDLTIDDPGQPWAIQIAAMLCNRAGFMPNFFSHIVKSDGRMAKENAVKQHGISARAADQLGIPERRVLGCLTDMLRTAPPRGMKVITFGDMDRRIVTSLLSRFAVGLGKSSMDFDRLWHSRPLTQFIDIQKPVAQQVCKLPSEIDDGSFKWPSLDEASQTILERPARAGIHDAWGDLLTIKELYFELAKRGYYEREDAADPAA